MEKVKTNKGQSADDHDFTLPVKLAERGMPMAKSALWEQIRKFLLGGTNATYLCSKIISTLNLSFRVLTPNFSTILVLGLGLKCPSAYKG